MPDDFFKPLSLDEIRALMKRYRLPKCLEMKQRKPFFVQTREMPHFDTYSGSIQHLPE